MISVAHNMLAMNANRQYNIVNQSKIKSTEKLSSGYKINRAADDAAGLSMSEKMRRQVRGLTQASSNCQDGVSFNQIADGAMNEISDMLNRMEVLSVKAANATLTDDDRAYIEKEIELLKQEIDHVEKSTTFNEIPVFAWDRKKTTYTEGAGGNSVISKVENFEMDKTHYGLVDVVGADYIYGGSKLDYQLKFTGNDWKSTGTIEYGTNEHVFGRTGGINQDSIPSLLSSLTSGKVSPDTIKTIISQANSYDKSISKTYASPIFATGASYNLFFDYSENVKDLKGEPIANSISLSQVSPTNTGLKTLELSTYTTRTSGVNNGKAYGSAWIDFSGLGSKYTIEDLYGQGFNSTCATCSKHYSIYFKGEGETTTAGSSSSPRLEINISACKTGEDVVDEIMKAVNANSSFTNHFQEYAVNSADPAKIYLYDNRNYWSDGGTSTFEPAARDENNQLIISTTTVHDKNGKLQYEIEDGDGIWIQAGSEAHSGFYNKRAHVSTWSLGIDGLSVATEENANLAMDMVRGAIITLSEQRSMVGAQQNRCENAIKVDDNSVENMTAAESRIRDTDMAKEMISMSISNILGQAGEAMLAQANQSNQGVLSLLQ